MSCSNVQNPDYEKNLEIAKEWFEVFVTEDFDAITEFFADEVEYQSAFYGGPLMNREETLNYCDKIFELENNFLSESI